MSSIVMVTGALGREAARMIRALASVRRTLAGVALVTLAGCSTYYPKRSPRIADVTEGYVRNGTTHPHGFLGSGLVDVVHGNPAAEKEARAYRNLSIGGFVLEVSGGAVQVGGLATASASRDPSTQRLGYLAAVGGGTLVLVGLILDAVAAPHRLDAINIYNDGVAVPVLAPAPMLPQGRTGPLGPRRDTTADAVLQPNRILPTRQ
jgi:hypothetical protein